MKLLAVLLTLMLFLSGCAKTAPPEQAAPEIDEGQILEYGEFEALCENSSGALSSNEKGAYLVKYINDLSQPDVIDGPPYEGPFYFMAFYIDYARGVMRPLCTLAGCEHDSPSCPAWKDTVQGRPTVLAAEDCLFWIYHRYNEIYEDGEKVSEQPARIEMSRLDGRGLRTLYSAKEGEYLLDNEPTLLFDGRLLCFEAAGEWKANRELVIIDTKSGEELKRHKLPQDFQLSGVFENRPLISQNIYKPLDNGGQSLSSLLYTLDPQSGEISFLTDPYRYFDPGTELGGEVFRQGAGGDLVAIDLDSGSSRVIGRPPSEVESFYVHIVADSHAVLNCYANGKYNVAYFADLESGEIYLSKMRYYSTYDAGTVRVDIEARTGDRYLVIMDNAYCGEEEPAPMRYWDCASGYTGYRYIYALIDKEDYWSNNPDYEVIELST